jgi:putative acetyltransferase
MRDGGIDPRTNPATTGRAAPEDLADSRAPSRADLEIDVDDPRGAPVRALLHTHLAFSRAATPREYSFALDVEHLADPEVTFFSARRGTVVAGVAALKRIDDRHAELKSMHTREEERRRGIAKALVSYILGFARQAGYERVSLETGTTDEFLPARSLYASMGFMPYGPFGGYQASPYNTFLSIRLDSRTSSASRAD